MWTRRELKDYAKGFLRSHYWKAFIVVLITTLLANGFGRVIMDPIQVYNSNKTMNMYLDKEMLIVSVPYGFEMFRSC
jgi:hypothetical protein